MQELQGNISLKREFRRFITRFFYSKEKNIENLSRMFFYLDDILSYVEKLQASIGTELLEKGLTEYFNEEVDKKVWLDEELGVILIDSISEQEKKNLSKKRNLLVEKTESEKALKNK